MEEKEDLEWQLFRARVVAITFAILFGISMITMAIIYFLAKG